MRIAKTSDGSREAFGSRLRTARARAGVTIQALAASTKVSASLFAALEEGDLSRWPRGIYRRSFFRQYVDAVGLPMEETFTEFERLFADELAPEDAPKPQADTAVPPPRPETGAIRMVIAALEWLTRKLSTA